MEAGWRRCKCAGGLSGSGGEAGGSNARTGTVARGSIVVWLLVGLDESGTCF